MQNSKKKVFGFLVVTFAAVVCALMFSLFANAQPNESLSNNGQDSQLAAVDAETVTVYFESNKDDLGNPDTLFSVDNTNWVSKLDLDGVPLGAKYTYTPTTTETGFTTLTFEKKDAQPQYSKTITFKSADTKMYSNMVKAYLEGNSGQNTTGIVSGGGKIISIAENLNLGGNVGFLCRSARELGNITGTVAKFQEWIDGNWVDLEFLNHHYRFHEGSYPTSTYEFSINSSNKTVEIKQYTIDPDKPWTKKSSVRTVRLAMLSSGFELIDIKALDFTDNKKIVDKLGIDATFFTANVGLKDYCVDGIKYSVVTLDGMKENIHRNVDNIIEELKKSGIASKYLENFAELIKELSAGVFSLPSTITCVSGLEEGYEPENLVIPATVQIPGKGTFPVVGITPGALDSDKIESVDLPCTLQVVFEDAATGLTNLEKLHFENGGLVYLPDYHANYIPSSESKWEDREYSNIEKLFYFLKGYKHVVKRISEGQAGHVSTKEIVKDVNRYLHHNMPSNFNTLGKYENLFDECFQILSESAFPYQMLASLQTGSTADGVDLALVVANDNSLAKPFALYLQAIDEIYPHNPLGPHNSLDFSDLDTIINDTMNISLKGTYVRNDDFKVNGIDEKFMFGTATFSSAVLDKNTNKPISGAVVTFTDGFGKTHTTTTDFKGAFTIDGLYQTGAFYDGLLSQTNIKPRNFSITAEGYEPIVEQETLSDYFPFRSYTYTNASGDQTSNVVWEKPALMESVYGESETGYLACAENTNFVVDISAGSKLSCANAQCYQFNGTKAQQFRVEKLDENKDGHELYKIVNINSGLVLDVAGGIAKNFNNVQQYKWNDSNAQKWYIEQSGNFVVYHSAIDPDYVLDLNAGVAQNGQNIQIYKANGSDAQKFLLLHSNPSVPGGDFDLVDGIYEIHAGNNFDNVLDVQWGSKDDFANVWAYKYNEKGDTNQQWRVTNLGYGYYSIVNVHSGKALDVNGRSVLPGANVQQYRYSDNNKAQIWVINKNADGTCSLVNAGTELVLDIAGGSTESKANVQGYYANGTDAQKWTFEYVGR